MQLCIGTSIAIIVPTTYWSYRAHLAKGAVLQGGCGASGAAEAISRGRGRRAGGGVPARRGVQDRLRDIRELHRAEASCSRATTGGSATNLPKGPLMSAYGLLLVGLCSSLMGVSGGSVSTLVLSLYGKPIHNSVATSSRASACADRSAPAPSGSCWRACRIRRCCRPCRSASMSLIGVALMAPVASFAGEIRCAPRACAAMSRRRLEDRLRGLPAAGVAALPLQRRWFRHRG